MKKLNAHIFLDEKNNKLFAKYERYFNILIHTLINEPLYLFEAEQQIVVDDLLRIEDKIIFVETCELLSSEKIITANKLKFRIKEKHKEDYSSQIDKIFETKENVLISGGLEKHIQQLLDMSKRLMLLNDFESFQKNIPNSSFEDFVKFLNKEIDKIRGEAVFSDKKQQIDEFKKELLEAYNRDNKAEFDGFKTYLENLDEKTLGFEGGSLNIIAARPAMGKTALVLSFIANNIKNNYKKKMIFFSLEMPHSQLYARLASILTGVNLMKIRRGDLTKRELDSIMSAMDMIEKSSLIVEDTSSVTIFQIVKKVKTIMQEDEVGLVALDYIQLVSAHSPGLDRRLVVDEISRQLKVLAKDNNIPVIALSQLNRDVEKRDDKRPKISDIRESGGIEQDADRIIFVYRDSVYKEKEKKEEESSPIDVVELLMEKQRQGPTGTIYAEFVKRNTYFRDAPDEVEVKRLENIVEKYKMLSQNNILITDGIFDIEISVH